MYTMPCPNTHPEIKNPGIRAQANMTTACGQGYTRHDGNGFDRASDVEYMGLHISVKARHFTLMAATLCEGKQTVEEIWEVYARRTHSNRFAYVLNEVAYMMDINEFHDFILRYGEVERESSNSDRKHTGAFKVRARRCEGDMLRWFNERLAA